MIEDWKLDKQALKQWDEADREDNLGEIEKLKKYLPIVLNECVTEKQRTYIIHYFVDKKNVWEIAEMYGVSKSTVSRGIHRGMRNAYEYLRFVSPGFADAKQKKVHLQKGRKHRKHRKRKVGDSDGS